MSLTNKVVMITGARGNLGSATAKAFAAQGARLVLIDRTADDAEKMSAQFGVPVHTDAGDLGDPAAIDAIIARATDKFGGIDALIHTVGGFASGTPVHETDVEVLEQMLSLNVRPIYVTAGRVAAHMVTRAQGGRIVIVLAKAALKGQKDSGAYTASKAAAQRLVESMALELRDHKINVNGVLPSIIDTPRNRQDMPNADPAKWVTPEQIAETLIFLASDAADAIHGASVEVYGRS
ncbi:MAG: SDR family NAD(P)-dependent oxidoreductase [Chloroflexota bacterium]|nr:SDR family NAD(P)-dependent oxidoreductase [Chloroflexota bacterium]